MRRSDWGELIREGRAVYTLVLNVGIGLHAIDVFVIATVMPAVARDIGGTKYYAWSTMLYMVASIIGAASGAPLKAAAGTRNGYVVAGLIFLAGTAGCGASPTMLFLLLGRTVQGLGGGLLLAQSMMLVSELYPAGVRTRALALISTVWGFAALVGPFIGGIFSEIGWWRGAFWTGVPVTLAFVAIAGWSLPAMARPPAARGIPIRRALLLGAGVLCVGLASTVRSVPLQLGLLIAAVAIVGLTFRLDGRFANRLFPSNALSLLSPVGAAYWGTLLMSAMHTAIGVFLPLAVQELHGVGPLAAGYFNAVLAVAWTVASIVTSGWRGRAEAALLVGGPLVATLALAALAAGVVAMPPVAIAGLVGLVGLGVGGSSIHLTAATMALALPGEESVTASSIPTIRSLGIAFGSAGAGLIANSAGLADGLSPGNVAAAVTWVYAIAAIAPAAAAVLALRVIEMRRRHASRTAPAAGSISEAGS